MGLPVNQTWEQINQPTGSFLQDAINALDNIALGTLSDYQKQQIDADNEASITQAAGGNAQLAQSEIAQYKQDVNNAVYSGLPQNLEDVSATIKQYAPWLIGAAILIYALPLLLRNRR